mmetsp:Transcript_78591/g.254584  ORF Transcript_78591/g.254584 Transcript_78591/m.254584 type:complete len:432 (+) Transcript_78591:304-1599(+)
MPQGVLAVALIPGVARFHDASVELEKLGKRDAPGGRQGRVEVPVQQHGREHELVEHVVVREEVHQLDAGDLLALVALGRAGRGRHDLHRLQLVVLPPPDLRCALHEAVDLVEVRGDLELLEDLREAGDDARAHEPHCVDVLQPQGLGEREVLAQELPDLRADPVLGEEAAELHRVVPDTAGGHEEGQALARPLVEDLDAQVREGHGAGGVLQHGRTGHEEGLEAQLRGDLGVLAHLVLTSPAPGPPEPVRPAVLRARADGLAQPHVAAQVCRGETFGGLRRQVCAALHQLHADALAAHEERDVEGRPAGDVGGVQRQLAVQELAHYRQRPAAASSVQARGAVDVAGVGVRAEDEEPPHCGQVGGRGKVQQQAVYLVQVLERVVEHRACRVARVGVVEDLVLAARLAGGLRAHVPAAERSGAVPHGNGRKTR